MREHIQKHLAYFNELAMIRQHINIINGLIWGKGIIQSVLSKLEIESYLEQDQKHNSVSLAELKRSSEFSAQTVQAYEWLLKLVAGEQRDLALNALLDLRRQFNQDSAAYAKVLLAEELLNVEQRKKLQAQQEEFTAPKVVYPARDNWDLL